VERIKDYLVRGHTYQVNHTFPLRASFTGDPWAFFLDLAAAQQGQYAAFIDTGPLAICSASPELFFRLDGDRLTARPMKGTAPRGRTLAEDESRIAELRRSEKNRAENLMIVDMIRNDLGRVAEIGSVAVPRLFEVERYPTLLQMTSTVTARTQASVAEILAHIFPCASITGAPKVRTMEIIRELEPQPRGIYTGAIGFIAPGRRAQFNVAIRTVLIDRERQQASYGVGSGLVWDSDAATEYAECVLKARVLTERRPSFQLLEALLWEPDSGYFLLAAHLERLANTAVYFQVPLDRPAIEAYLTEQARTLTEPGKIRLRVALDGRFTVEVEALAPEVPARPDPGRPGPGTGRFQHDLAVSQDHPARGVRRRPRVPTGLRRGHPMERAWGIDRGQHGESGAGFGWRMGHAAGHERPAGGHLSGVAAGHRPDSGTGPDPRRFASGPAHRARQFGAPMAGSGARCGFRKITLSA
jgi:para-aminobenzoate synthetase / 4-amino-4-deoxychorismate lyase